MILARSFYCIQCARSDSSMALVGVSGELPKIGAEGEDCGAVIDCVLVDGVAALAMVESDAARSLADSSRSLR